MIYQLLNQSAGVNSNVSPFLQPQDSPTVLNNCVTSYKIGSIVKDVGYSAVGNALQADKSILGLFDFKEAGGTQKMLATVDDATSDDTQLFYKTDAGAWTEITGAETAWANKAGITVSMESFIGYTFFAGYGSTDGYLPVASLIGTTFSTSTNVTDMPKAKQVIKYRDRLYAINCQIGATSYPFRIYRSSVPSAGAITWTVATDFNDVDTGEELVGAGSNWDRLVAFTEDNAYFYDQSSFKLTWATGCSSWRTIKNSGPYMIWGNSDGVWISSGGQPENISGPVIDYFRASNPRLWFSECVDEEYWIYIGNVTVNGLSYSNLALVFNIPTNQWRTREFSHPITSFARKNLSGAKRLYMGSSNGKVYDKGKHTDSTLVKLDDTSAFGSNFELAPTALQTLLITKESDNFVAYADKAVGLKLSWRTLDKNTRAYSEYQPLGELTKYINTFDVNLKDAAILQISGAEYGGNEFWSFFGFEMEVEKHSDILKIK